MSCSGDASLDRCSKTWLAMIAGYNKIAINSLQNKHCQVMI